MVLCAAEASTAIAADEAPSRTLVHLAGENGGEPSSAESHESCKHWVRRGFCIFGDTCKFLHLESERGAALPPPPVGNSNAARRKANRGIGKRNSVKNRFRASAFRRFLLDTFGEEALRGGSGVLDVAGGKGELSFEFVNLHQLRSTVLDPRPLQLTKFEKYLKKGLYHRNAVFRQSFSRSVESAREEDAEPPPHLRMCLANGMIQHLQQLAGSAGGGMGRDTLAALHGEVKGAMAEAARMRWTRKGLECGGHEEGQEMCVGSESEESDVMGEDEEDGVRWEREQVCDTEEAVELLLNCSAVVGMHPDQATEPIVDLALSLGKPFAVVPCCVYGRCFPRRRMPSGDPVNTYEEFIEYLLAKSPTCMAKELPFEGRNTVIYGSGEVPSARMKRPTK